MRRKEVLELLRNSAVGAAGLLAAGCTQENRPRLDYLLLNKERFVGKEVVVQGYLVAQEQGRAPDVCSPGKPKYYSDKLHRSDFPSSVSVEIVHCEPESYRQNVGDSKFVVVRGKLVAEKDTQTGIINNYYIWAESVSPVKSVK